MPTQFKSESPPNFRRKTTYIATTSAIRLSWLARAINQGKNVNAKATEGANVFGDNPEIDDDPF